MKKRLNGKKIIIAYFAFFLFVAAIITCAVLIYSCISGAVSTAGEISIIMLIVVFFLAGVCTAVDFLRRKIMVDRPVKQILKATEQITAGDFNVKLKPSHLYKNYDAYDVIMENINKMAEELSRNEVLKSDFISNVSHEIKTPLSVISNYALMLGDEGLSAAEKEEYTKKIISATARLTSLVANILKLNKIENQAIGEKKNIPLGDFLGEIILGFEGAIEEKNINLECDIADITVSADKTFMEIICGNLLSNAVKFTDEGGEITVTLKAEGENAVLCVADTGCGMDEETGKRIFDKFYQGDTSHSGEGNGLGLSLVKKVIDIIGGEISVKSEKGKGSVFTVKWKM